MPPENEAEPQNLRDVLSQAVTDAEAAAPEPTPARERPAETSDSTGAEQRDDGRARGPDGKFIQKDAAGTTEAPEEGADAASGEPGGEEAVAAAEPVAPPAAVPQHWSQADKEMIAGLPEEHRAKVIERYKAIETGFTPRLREAAQIRAQFQGAMEIFAPHAEGLRQRGQTPSDVIRAWASIEQDLMQGQQLAAQGQPNIKGAQHVARMIQHYNVDPGVVASILRGETPQVPGGNGATHEQVHPAVLQELRDIRARQDARDAAEARRNEGASQAQIDAFANEKSETGALKHPFFSELESDMMNLARIDISQGKVPSVSDLYDRAVYANRETRAKVLAANSAEAQRKAAAERKAKAEAATRASSSVVGSPGSGGSPAERRGPRSLRDEIADAAAEIDAA